MDSRDRETVEEKYFIKDTELDKEQYKFKSKDERKRLQVLAKEAYEKIAKGEIRLLKAVLNNFSKFETYSSNNLILITIQSPKATELNSFDDWKRQKLFIKSGEQSIKILEPVNILKNGVLERYMNVKRVFDVSQTNKKVKFKLPEYNDEIIQAGLENFSIIKPYGIINLPEDEIAEINLKQRQVYIDKKLHTALYNIACFDSIIKAEMLLSNAEKPAKNKMIIAIANCVFAKRYYPKSDFAETFIPEYLIETEEYSTDDIKDILYKSRELLKRVFRSIKDIAAAKKED